MYKPIFTEKEKKASKRKAVLKEIAIGAAAVGIFLIASVDHWG